MTSPSPTRRGLADHRSIGSPARNAVVEAEFRNRYLVSAKLSGSLYEDFARWCKDCDLSFNEALKQILRTHLAKPQP